MQRRRRRGVLQLTLACAGLGALCLWRHSRAAAPATDDAPAAAFVTGAVQRTLLSPRVKFADEDAREPGVAMHDGTRRARKYGRKKKLHDSEHLRYQHERLMTQPYFIWQISSYVPAHNLEQWSQTLKLTFAEGEDDVVTEEEVMEFFTTEDFKPETVVVGHKEPHESQKHTFVHFATREECKKARKEKNSGAIGKASEVKAVYTDERKWIRVRDGMSAPMGGGRRGPFMKPYGDLERYEGYGKDERLPDKGARSNPVYPF